VYPAGAAHWEDLTAYHAVNVHAVWHVERRQGVRRAHELLQGGWRLKIAWLANGPEERRGQPSVLVINMSWQGAARVPIVLAQPPARWHIWILQMHCLKRSPDDVCVRAPALLPTHHVNCLQTGVLQRNRAIRSNARQGRLGVIERLVCT
jgi:hypothetical protein